MNTQEHHELYEKSRNYVQQKKSVYLHFIFLIIGAVFLFIINNVFKIGVEKWGFWYQWAVTLWFFLWVYHLIHVFIIHRFFGKDWERAETDKLIVKHFERLKSLEKKLVKAQIITPEETDSTTQNN